jgi:hypothetical protein
MYGIILIYQIYSKSITPSTRYNPWHNLGVENIRTSEPCSQLTVKDIKPNTSSVQKAELSAEFPSYWCATYRAPRFGFHVRLAVIKSSVRQTGRGQDNTKILAVVGQPCSATLCINRLRGSDHYRLCSICFNVRQLCMLSTEVTGHFSYFLH